MKTLAPVLLILILTACGTPAPTPEPPKETTTAATKTFEFTFDNIQKPPEDFGPTRGTAWVTITKFDPQAGEVKISFNHTEGDRIGWGTHREGGVTSIHRVFSKKLGMIVSVDFDTGAVIKGIKVDIVEPYQFRSCKIVRGPQGSKPCDGIEMLNDTFRANVVTYLGQNGNLISALKPIDRGPKEDQLCTLHGGNIPPKPVETEDRRKLRLANEAATLLWQADNEWVSKNPKVRTKARDTYRLLLKEYSSEGVVEKSRDRIKARSVAEIED